jgi:AraC family transcriptional regulator of adaptative response / DNA-3-methyladenine glycosylase II
MDASARDACYRAVQSRDRRFDGVFYTGVRTTGIYCRPSCPARTPHLANVTFHATAAAAQAAGYRACRRCLPDATPGSPAWDVAADVAGRAMRLIGDGLVEREGVSGLAARLGYSPRHLTRVLTAQLGAGPLALARARRAQVARTLLETTELRSADVAYAAGFASIRQFNETMQEVYGASPRRLRGRAGRGPAAGTPASRAAAIAPAARPPTAPVTATTTELTLRLAVRAPFAASAWLEFMAARAVPGVEAVGAGGDRSYARTLGLPHGQGVVRLSLPADTATPGRPGERAVPGTTFVTARLRLTDLRDLSSAVERCRRLLDADCDPVAVDEQLAGDPFLARLVTSRPGLRVPGTVDGVECAVRTVLGQQVSVAAARTTAQLLARRHGAVLPDALREDGLTRVFPTAEALAAVAPDDLPMPRARGRALVALCEAVAAGDLALDRSRDRAEVRARLLELLGVGPWTAGHVALRGLGDPDVLLETDLGYRAALRLAGVQARPERWRPWRSYALMHLWTSLADPLPGA